MYHFPKYYNTVCQQLPADKKTNKQKAESHNYFAGISSVLLMKAIFLLSGDQQGTLIVP